jgi:hypothetical protein
MVSGKNVGLIELYEKYGVRTFRGSGLREVMVDATCGKGKPAAKAGWQASIALGRLVSAGVVDIVQKAEGKAKWDSTYQVSEVGVALARRALGVEAETTGGGKSKVPPMPTPPGAGEYLDKLTERGTATIRGLSWKKWAFVQWARERGLIETADVVTVTITDAGRQWDGEDVEPIQGSRTSVRGGSIIACRLYHVIKAKGLSPARNGVSAEEIVTATGIDMGSVTRQLVQAEENGYVRTGNEGYYVVLGEQ